MDAAGLQVGGELPESGRWEIATQRAGTHVRVQAVAEAGRDVQLGGNIGTAILSLDPPRTGRYHVVECSSFQIDLGPGINPSIGVLLNVTPDHMDRYSTLEEYAAAKARIFANQSQEDWAVLNADDPDPNQRLTNTIIKRRAVRWRPSRA